MDDEARSDAFRVASGQALAIQGQRLQAGFAGRLNRCVQKLLFPQIGNAAASGMVDDYVGQRLSLIHI